MAIRLPEQQFLPVQSLGRYDIFAPVKTAQARVRALENISQGVQAVNKWVQAEDEANTNEAVANYKAGVDKLREDLKRGDTIDISQYPDVEFTEEELRSAVRITDPETGDEQYQAPTFRVIAKIYDAEEQRLREEFTSGLTNAGREVFDTQTVRFRTSSGSEIASRHFDSRHAFLNQRFTMAYEQSIANMDEEAARKVISDGLAVGAFTAEEGLNYARTLGPKLDYARYTRGIAAASAADDTEALSAIVSGMWEDPANRMTLTQKLDVQTKAQSALASTQSRVNAEEVKERRRQSAVKSSQYMVEINERGKVSETELNSMLVTLEPEDRKALITLNYSNPPPQSDLTYMSHLEIEIMNLAQPVPGVTMRERQNDMRDRLRYAMGFDRITGQRTGDAKLTTADYLRLDAMIRDMASISFEDPMFGEVEDRIYRAITSAGKDMYGMNNSGEYAAALNEVLKVYYDDAVRLGAQFDPVSWYEKNKGRIESSAYLNNVESRLESLMEKYLVRSAPRAGELLKPIDIRASVANLDAAYEAGDMDRQLYIDLRNMIEAKARRQ